MSINTTEILNKLYDKLKTTIDGAEISKYYPNRKLSVPLNGKFNVTIGIKSDSVNTQINQQIIVFDVELLSPVNSTGEAIFAKANQITSVLLSTDILPVQSCVIGDIEYITSQRAYRTNITLTAQKLFDENAFVIVGDTHHNCTVISEKELYTACDIKVYGQSKPIDTILTACEYVLNIKLKKPDVFIQNRFEIKTGRYKYLNCFVKKVENSNGFSEYEIISKERLAI